MSTQEELEAAEKAAKEKEEAEKKAAEEKAKEEKKKELDFDKWLNGQPEDVQKLYGEHISGLKSALDKEREANKTNKGALEKLAKFEEAEKKRTEAEMTEMEKMQKRAEEAESKWKEYETKENKRKIAQEVGLPLELADRIRGETPEEMKADAQTLLAVVPKAPKISATIPGQNATGQPETDEEALRRIHSGGAPGIFSRNANQAQGGGVYYSPGKSGGVVE